MDYPWAVPGAKVVCIKPKPPHALADAVYPVVGLVYTIRDVKPVGYGGLRNPVLMLQEIDNSHIKPEPYEPGFGMRGFRPLYDANHDLAKFTHLLTPQKIEERA